MAGLVKFRNPLYNPEAVKDALRQIAALKYQGSYIIEHRGGRVSNISFSSNSEPDVINSARGFKDANPDIVCIRIPLFNVVIY